MESSTRTRIPWRLVTAAWLLPTIADVADTYIARRVEGQPAPFWHIMLRVAPGWLVWILFTPVIFWFGARVRIERPVRATAVLSHLAGSIVVGLAHALVSSIFVHLTTHEIESNWHLYWTMVEDWLPVAMLLYWMTLGAGYALEGSRRARAQALRTTELEGQLVRSELAVLRAQLHPHFLFNALNTAVSLVRANQPEAGVHVLTHLADLLRQLVHGVEQEVTMREELQLLESYIEIERARFGDRLSIDVSVPSRLLDAYVPGLVLQPLVENALRHGIGRLEAAGRVTIDASATSNVMRLVVSDDGPGFVLDAPAAELPGVGIANTRARLSRLYGDVGTLSLHNGASGGADVVVSLPLRFTPVHGPVVASLAARAPSA
jgi:two-component system, LytTR family, sensor kinase